MAIFGRSKKSSEGDGLPRGDGPGWHRSTEEDGPRRPEPQAPTKERRRRVTPDPYKAADAAKYTRKNWGRTDS
ncbi:hypothetical protein RCO28_34460 [Streptomyces sp. LHD-70]|uniref:hypothetical protein n=1 Tax=Streptomyces sp. LHD-70 TaxID=3072140 RepID=UPI00280DA092|nr:hypothetical protein [Streptomyces sp. LHD-70]MDQ8707536.1 hypothetical protein [Streptomyces sp. LHD-70]